MSLTTSKKIIKYEIEYIASNIPLLAKTTDPHIVNSWGIVVADDKIWVANNVSDSISGYSTIHQYSRNNGNLINTIKVTSTNSTGLVKNYGCGFNITSGSVTKSSQIIVVTETGAIDGYNYDVDPNNTIPLLQADPDVSSGRVFKGVSISDDYKFIYVTDFRHGVINKYDSDINLVLQFTDDGLVNTGYAPFNVKVICDEVYVTFAKQDDAKYDDEDGTGNGYIDIFDHSGHLLRRFANRGHLNTPWGMSKCGNILLVSNNGDGKILKFSLCSGEFKGYIKDGDTDAPIEIDGVWGISNTEQYIYFAAGLDDENYGGWGRLRRKYCK